MDKVKKGSIAIGIIGAFFMRNHGIDGMVLGFLIGIAVATLVDFLMEKVGL